MAENATFGVIDDARRKRRVIDILGKAGSGKSFYLKTRVLPEYNRAIVVTPTDESYPGVVEFEDAERMVRFCLRNKVFRVLLRCNTLGDLCPPAGLALSRGDTAVFIDEAQRFFPAGTARAYPQVIYDLFFRSRHRRVDLILAHQRATTVSIDIRSQWTDLVTFRQTESADTSWIRGTTGEALPDLERLPVGEYYHVTNQGECHQKIIKEIYKF